MKNSNKLSKLFALSIMALTITSCGSSTNAGGGGGDSDNSQGVEITSANTVVANSTLNLAATLTFATTTTPTFIWTIRGNTTFASINGNTLTGISPGNITLVATYGTRTGTQKFTVTPAPPVIRPTITTAFNAPVATGTPNEVTISWAAVTGATGYKLYRTTDNLSGFENGDPTNLASANPAATSTDVSGITTNINLGANSAKTYFLLTAITNGIESKTNGAQTFATAHPLAFGTVAGGGTDTVWMDRNLGATRKATSSTDTDAYGDLYQWGRARDGHQISTSTTTATLAPSISPGHAEFITDPAIINAVGRWTAVGVDDNGAIRSAIWSRTDGSGVCPTGFRVPTAAELEAERVSWTSANRAGAFASTLKWAGAGVRAFDDADIILTTEGYYWSSTVSATEINKSRILVFNVTTSVGSNRHARGASIRCIQN
ncbi:MAG: hypothetical protein HAW58_00060 [Candidatus Thioglobus sp.]|nr:hypothetical protein [Candidatus Thioglobus sp.]